MNLRPYQQEAVAAVRRDLQEYRSTLVVAPTGTGKTVIFGHLAKGIVQGRLMFIAHRDELIRQAAEKLERITGKRVGVEKAESYADTSLFTAPSIVVASIQTLTMNNCKRLKRFRPEDFAEVYIDEAHHAPAPTYRAAIEHFRLSKIVGMTATPDRADEAAMGSVFESVAFEYMLPDAIHDGWLVPIRSRSVEVNGLDYSGVRDMAGDVSQADIAKSQSSEEVLHRMAAPIAEIAGDRRTIVFVPGGYSGGKHGDEFRISERFTEVLRRYRGGVADVARVAQDTPPEERASILRRFAAGEIRYIVNVGILTEGFDDPGVECVALARPTKSRALFAQMVGRGTRPLPGVVDGVDGSLLRKRAIAGSPKPYVEVIDLVGNCGAHRFVHAEDVLGGRDPDEVIVRARAKLAAGGDVLDAIDEAREEYEEEERTRKFAQAMEAKRRNSIIAKVDYEVHNVDPFDVFGVRRPVERGWDVGRVATPGQLKMLMLHGVPVTDNMPFAEAKRLVGIVLDRAKRKLVPFKIAAQRRAAGLEPDVTMGQHMNEVFAAKRAMA